MADKNVGGIEWTVDADTKGAVNSVNKMGMQVDSTTTQLKKLDTQTTKTAKSVKTGLAGMSRGAGQAGVQVQQFIGQIQGGQSAMLALSQQAADIGIVLGAPLVGAIAGISASIVGMLVPSLMKSTNALELLEKATENVKASLTLSVDGVAEYTDEMKKLKAISEALVQVKLANLIAEQAEALKIAQKGIKTSVDDLRGSFDDYGDIVKKIYKEYTPKTVSSMRELQKALREVGRDASPERLEALETALINATDAGINSTKAGRGLANQLVTLISEYKTGTKTISEIKKALSDSNVIIDDSTEKTKDNAKAIVGMVEALQLQAEAVGKTNREIALKTATEKGATDAQIRSINASFDIIEAEEKRLEGIKLLAAEQKELDRIMEQSFQNDVKRAQSEKTDKNKAVGVAESVISRGASPIERLENEQEQLLALKAKYVEESALFDEALTVNAKKQADLRHAYQVANANMILNASSNLFGGLADMLKSSGKEQSNAYKAMFALSKGFAIAQAALNLSLAISNASAITPWYASIPAVASVVAAGAGLTSAIAGATYSGRENGGPVISGKTYEVGEKNKPEMLMIPGNNGKVFSNAEMKSAMGGGGSSGGVEVNLYGAPQGTNVESRKDPTTEKQIIDIVIGQMGNPNSPGRRILQGNSNVSGVLNGQRRI